MVIVETIRLRGLRANNQTVADANSKLGYGYLYAVFSAFFVDLLRKNSNVLTINSFFEVYAHDPTYMKQHNNEVRGERRLQAPDGYSL